MPGLDSMQKLVIRMNSKHRYDPLNHTNMIDLCFALFRVTSWIVFPHRGITDQQDSQALPP